MSEPAACRYLVTCSPGKALAFLLYMTSPGQLNRQDFLAFHLAEFGKNGGSRFLQLVVVHTRLHDKVTHIRIFIYPRVHRISESAFFRALR